jgi:transcriptional regulator
MYVPANYAQKDLAKLHDFIGQDNFGLLISDVEGRPFATHVPFLLDRTAGPKGSLTCHVARANPQWRDVTGQEVLAVFAGPHAYISPTWYAAEQVVPTWNYVSVHAYGRVTLIDEPAALIALVKDLVVAQERSMPKPWSLGGPDEFVRRLVTQIVGFRIAITHIEGKWKLGQNHPPERRKRVAAALSVCPDDQAREVARLMEETITGETDPTSKPCEPGGIDSGLT